VQREDSQPGEGFEESFVWRVAYQILQGLRVLHLNKVIHRDIKSANVFFVGGVAKLGDLNVSKIAENGLCSTHTGTPYFTSPEIWKGLEYGNKCDIWATGCLIFELCTLKRPFQASDFPSLFRKVIRGEYDDIPAKYSQKMRELVRLCLTVEVDMRPSAAELLDGSLFRNIDEALSAAVSC
jgi:NIMA (never in mitosis gene a)-related kinase